MRDPVRLLILLLVVLGVILIGFVAGRGCDRHQAKRGERIITLLDECSIPESRRTKLKEKLRAALPDAEGKKVRRRLNGEVIAILEAEQFDAEAYRESLDKMFLERQRQKQRVLEVMVEIASELNWEERKALAEIFRRSPRFKYLPRTN
ncbi:MAG: periplasmic heavy metal sensor [Candidatus Dadabacteria bacterium]|nr:periplasmic heavy metal sensor [Candidatus Dadabacteria bacterium]MYE61678.1 periplasmic heavy metal sensor [Candidatus Dadabacteria bacterium]MYI73017.1 periplasmic heavy metal sensor [Candidatus Dadabacteria bacterium]